MKEKEKKERKAFQNLPHEENPHHLENGIRIYKELKEKYPQECNEDLDSILNSLCCALICLIKISVDPDNRRNVLQLIHIILSKNL